MEREWRERQTNTDRESEGRGRQTETLTERRGREERGEEKTDRQRQRHGRAKKKKKKKKGERERERGGREGGMGEGGESLACKGRRKGSGEVLASFKRVSTYLTRRLKNVTMRYCQVHTPTQTPPNHPFSCSLPLPPPPSPPLLTLPLPHLAPTAASSFSRVV